MIGIDMNNLRKKQMLEFVLKLENVIYEIRKNREKVAGLNSTEILAQCQETALILGNYLETLGGEFNSLVEILEAYCEELYQMSLVLTQEDKYAIATEKVFGLLKRLRDGIQSKVPDDKKEIVFLPYKVSMWDSLESVWKAAAEDEHCEVYVIPIPYFDKNPDGTFGRMHYEGGEYPKYVPVTSWQAYNISDRKPDVVFIHNPYDDWNHVTSVHPNFYAKDLIKYTSCLVYIPYFTVANNNMERSLCVLPGTLFANKVVVQSEEIKNIYLEELYKFEKKNCCEGVLGDIGGKILALGSPKYDKVFNTKKEDLILPQAWEDIMRKAKGQRNIVILYNISIVALLEHGETWLDKIENTLSIFRNLCYEVTLLWRPHPLIEATLKAMRPQLLERYHNIVSRYIDEKWGIYDDSGDVDRAIILSDGYYGDGGSVLELFQKTGKPIMLQNINILNSHQA